MKNLFLLALTLSLGTDALVWTADSLSKGKLLILATNDTSKTVSADVSGAELLINGKPVKNEAARNLLSVNKNARPLKPKEHYMWGSELSVFLSKPGFYRFRIKGKGVESNEARVLILP